MTAGADEGASGGRASFALAGTEAGASIRGSGFGFTTVSVGRMGFTAGAGTKDFAEDGVGDGAGDFAGGGNAGRTCVEGGSGGRIDADAGGESTGTFLPSGGTGTESELVAVTVAGFSGSRSTCGGVGFTAGRNSVVFSITTRGAGSTGISGGVGRFVVAVDGKAVDVGLVDGSLSGLRGGNGSGANAGPFDGFSAGFDSTDFTEKSSTRGAGGSTGFSTSTPMGSRCFWKREQPAMAARNAPVSIAPRTVAIR